MGSEEQSGFDWELLAGVRSDVRYALGQLRNFGETDRALRALEQADDRLADLFAHVPVEGLVGRVGPATPENAGARFPAVYDPFA
jgi:hypothetical protein